MKKFFLKVFSLVKSIINVRIDKVRKLEKLPRWIWIVLIFWLMVAAFWKLGSIPRAFDGDEAAFGYYASSLIESGTDEFGNKWPLYFKSIGDYKYPGYSYLSILPVGVMGLSVFSTRFLSALAGVITLILLIKMLENLDLLPQKQKWLVVVGVILASLSSWFLVFSRAAKEANLGLTLVMVSFYGLSKCMERLGAKKSKTVNWWMILSFVGLLLAGMSYVAYRVLGLGWLMISSLVVVNRKKIRRRWWIGSLVTASFIVVSMINPLSRVRSEGLILTNEAGLWDQAQSQIWEVGMVLPRKSGVLLARAFDNKWVTVGWDAMRRYLGHFDASFLFVSGNPNLPWYSIPKVGMLMLMTIPFVLLGFYELGQGLNKNWLYQVMFGWFLISPLPSALAVESPNPIRSLAMFPVFVFIIFLGIKRLSDWEKENLRWVLPVIVVLVVINGVFVLKQFVIHREGHRPWYSEQGVKEMVKFVAENMDKYEQVVIPRDPYIFFLFFGEPEWKNNLIATDRQWDSVESIGKIKFLMPYDCPKTGKVGVLYICKGMRVPINSKVVFVSRFNDYEPAYFGVEFSRLSKVDQGNLPALPDRFKYMVESDVGVDGIISTDENRYW